MSAFHSPLPWHVVEHSTSETGIYADKKRLAGLSIDENGDYCDESRAMEANAAFIVRACNSHYDLLAACKEALPGITAAVEERLRAAIAKAEGK